MGFPDPMPLPRVDTAPMAALGHALSAFGQREDFVRLAIAKRERSDRLKAHFRTARPRRLVLGPRLTDLDPEIDGWQVERLPAGAFHVDGPPGAAALALRLADAVVIVNNNDLGPDDAAFAAIQAACPRTVFIGWDWDNHHWLARSATLAAHCDLYAPGHGENLYLLTRFNPDTIGPVHCASVQWSRRELADLLPLLLSQPRSDLPLGMHIPYAHFAERNRIVAALHEHFPTVGFSGQTFHGRTSRDRLAEWAGHKAHWIVPVLNDIPCRLFDALATGGVPLVPASMRHLDPIRELDERHVVFYSPQDIERPQAVVAQANAQFDAGGSEGLVARHRLGLERHHGNSRVATMIDYAARHFGWKHPG